MKTNYVLIDYENVHVKSLALLQGEHFRVKVFLGPKNTKLPVELVLAMHNFGERAEYIVLEAHGINALDFHIAYYLGILATNDPNGFFHVISRDTGFDPLLQHLKARKISCRRSNSIEEMPCFPQPVETLPSVTDQPREKQPETMKTDIDGMVSAVIDDLIKRKASKPRTVKTLRGTIQAKLGKSVPTVVVESVYDSLISQGYVRAEGTKVAYALPPA